MSRKTRKRPSSKPVAQMLAGFEANERRRIGSSDSAHRVAIGTYRGREVAVKPFRSKSGIHYAEREARVTREVLKHGFRGFEPLEVMNLRRFKTALLISRYVPDLTGAHTMTVEARPGTLESSLINSRLGRIAATLGQLHGQHITHGDAQVKNFAFRNPRAVDPTSADPFIYDFEKGTVHESGGDRFRDDAATDVNKLVFSLGNRQFGGPDDTEASELAREVVILPYLDGPVSEELSRRAIGQAVDGALASFTAGRNNQKIPDQPHLHMAAPNS